IAVNSDENFPNLPFKIYATNAFKKAKSGEFDIGGLNVYMLGIVIKNVANFPFSYDEICKAIEIFNPKVAEKNKQILKLAMES
ncbi:MAG: ferredoxin oxidoreductase, partial [Campylobacter sp.]|nr:ferredoxin oxidoreductase [Campylobacter sp.]